MTTVQLPKAFVAALIATIVLLAGTTFLLAGAGSEPASGTRLMAAPAELEVPELAQTQLGQWCTERQAAGTDGLSDRAKAWLADCIAVTATSPTANPTASPTWTQTPSPTPSPTATSPSPSPTATPTPTVTPTPTPTPSTSTSPPGAFPTATSVGAPRSGWTPVQRSGTWTITAPGVYQDVRITGSIRVRADGVTLRRIDVIGGTINNEESRRCYNGLVLEDVTVRQAATYTNSGSEGVIGPGGYTARRVAIIDRVEGFRVGGRTNANCGPVTIEDSYVRVTPPQPCGDWHGDGLQGYDGPALTVRRTALHMIQGNCGGTAPFFVPGGSSNNLRADIDGLLVSGGGYPFRLGVPATVRGVRIVDNSWGYGPVAVDCTKVTVWDVQISDAAGNALRPVRCTG